MAEIAVESGFRDYVTASVLDSDEEIRWTGHPGRLACMGRGVFESVFGLAMFLFAVIGAAHLSVQTGALGWVVFLPFLVGGLYFLTMPIQFGFLASRTSYFITDRRVIVVVHFIGTRVQSYFADDVRYFETIDRGSDRGSIRLRFSSVWRGFFSLPSDLYLRGGLWGIDRLSEAARAIQRIKMAECED
ncbi:MAG: hypothetical protein RLO01_07020 [Thalassobaculaceae bacterium]